MVDHGVTWRGDRRTAGTGAGARTGAKRILVVDDDDDFSAAIGEILHAEGYTVRLAHGVAEACERAANFDPQVALLDIRLGRDNGITLIGKLKAVRRDILCVMMTGHAALDTAIQALQQGAYNYLRKPIDGLDLLNTLERCFEKLALEQDKYQAEMALSQRNAELSTLTVRLRSIVESTRYLAGIQSIDKLAPVLAGELEALAGAEHGCLYLHDGDAYARVKDTPILALPEKVTAAALRDSALRELVETLAPVLVEDTGRDGFVGLPGCEATPRGSLLILPLFGETPPLAGFAVLHRTAAVPFQPQEQDVGLLFASVCSEILRGLEASGARSRLAAAVEHAAESILITDPDGRIQYVNPAFEKLMGYTREETIGQTPRIIRSGKMDHAFYERLWTTISTGDVWQGRFINKTKSGELLEQEATISAIRDSRGAIVNYVSVARDVTHEVELEARLRQAQKLEAIGTLAGGIAHDFNNMLSPILGYAELALLSVEEGSELWHNIREIHGAGKRASELVKQILAFSRRADPERKLVDLHGIACECLQLLRGSLPATVSIETDLAECPPILADPTQIHQVIMNLCTNAYHAMREDGGTLRVGLKTTRVALESPDPGADLAPGDYVVLSVADTGRGMSGDTLERIFEPYFTTKRTGEGTGLGLATVHGIIQGHRGHITVQSTPGAGSTFHVYFRVAEQPDATAKTAAAPPDSRSGQECILLVDDEPAIIAMLDRGLTALGYRVEGYTDSMQALEAFERHPGQYDLLLTDQTMPRIAGLDLARRVLEHRPDFPVILTTGYSDSVNEQSAREAGIREFLLKPVSPRHIAERIRAIFGTPPS